MRFPAITSRAILVGALTTSLVLAACSGDAGGAAAQGPGATGEATISIATPSDGASVSVPFEVQLESSVPLGEPATGNHHAHLYFDTDTSAADYDIVYGTSWQVTRQLSPGTHTIIAALANPDHSLAGPTATITITVGGGDSGDGGTPASQDTDPLY